MWHESHSLGFHLVSFAQLCLDLGDLRKAASPVPNLKATASGSSGLQLTDIRVCIVQKSSLVGIILEIRVPLKNTADRAMCNRWVAFIPAIPRLGSPGSVGTAVGALILEALLQVLDLWP